MKLYSMVKHGDSFPHSLLLGPPKRYRAGSRISSHQPTPLESPRTSESPPSDLEAAWGLGVDGRGGEEGKSLEVGGKMVVLSRIWSHIFDMIFVIFERIMYTYWNHIDLFDIIRWFKSIMLQFLKLYLIEAVFESNCCLFRSV